jgi:ABC-type uncharacterized transport system substrate-binding protein
MKRRGFITLLGSAAAGWPLAARAQQSRIPTIGWLALGQFGPADAFRQGLADAGYVEGRNVVIEFRLANQPGMLSGLAADLVSREVAVIFVNGSPSAALAAKAATSTIPLVFVSPEDPRKYGLVTSLNRPEGNVTGINLLVAELAGKRLQLLSELVPRTTTIAYLAGPPNAVVFESFSHEILEVARALGRDLFVMPVIRNNYDAAFSTIAERRAGALIVGNYSIFNVPSSRRKILELAARHNLPAIYSRAGFIREGGLMSYGPNTVALFRQLGSDYVGGILKGTKPVDLPVQQPTQFELVINLKTAKALGLTIPRVLFATATRVIE